MNDHLFEQQRSNDDVCFPQQYSTRIFKRYSLFNFTTQKFPQYIRRHKESLFSYFFFERKVNTVYYNIFDKMKLSLAIFGLAASTTNAFSTFAPTKGAVSSTSLNMSLEKYSDELKETAAKMVRPGYGLLACDESNGTVGTRLESIGLENVEKNRQEVSLLPSTNQ